MLWSCLHFADFSLQLATRAMPVETGSSSDTAPPAPLIITTGGNQPRVVSCNSTARSHGVTPGMTVSAAVALASDLIEVPRNLAAEQRALEGAAAWGCGAFRNDPRMVAELFREVLDEPALAAPLSEIVFAVFEADRDRGNRAAFEAAFAR